jgi:predicted Rossmann fold flavoprotein
MVDVVVIGGGAAGFFGALQAAEKNPKLRILILEKSTRLLAKVKISGGGRCNVTHHEFTPRALSGHYPRGEKFLRALFTRYQPRDVVDWFALRGIELITEQDGRMFPATHSSQTIIDCFLREANRYAIQIETHAEVIQLERVDDHFRISTRQGNTYKARKVLVAMGGHPNREAYQWLAGLGHTITPTVPSLFTFNDPSKKFQNLMGVSVPDALVKITGAKFSSRGPVLITHWGLSGPAVIRLSAWAAEWLAEKQYTFIVLVNWLGSKNEDELRQELLLLKTNRPKLNVTGSTQFALPVRLWQRLCAEAEVPEEKTWGELSLRSMNKLLEQLIRCPFSIRGKTTFKEEFVTCGGVDLNEINPQTMESKKVSGLFFAGEVLNIDGETGGFNFQGAWTTAWVASQAVSR